MDMKNLEREKERIEFQIKSLDKFINSNIKHIIENINENLTNEQEINKKRIRRYYNNTMKAIMMIFKHVIFQLLII